MDRSVRDADVVVVGSGIGGLVTAAYLAAIGRKVVVVERHSVAGGNATAFHHRGYEFDVGVHYVGDCGPNGSLTRILAPLGIDIPWRPMDPDGFDTLLYPDMTFRIPKGVDRFRERLHEAFPSERDGVDRYLETIVAIDHGLVGGGDFAEVMRHAGGTLGALFDELRLSARLRNVLAAENGTYAVPPSRVSLILHAVLVMHYLKDGAYYPEGGGQVIADRLVETIERHGGEVLVRAPVERIVVEGGQVRGVRLRPPSVIRRQGVPDEIRAPVVVSNADLKRTVSELVGEEHFPTQYVDSVRGYTMTLPLFVVYLVIDRDLATEGYANSNLYVCPPDDDIDACYAVLESGRMPEPAAAYVTLTSLKDPTNPRLCRPGQTNLQVMSLAPRDYAFWGVEQGPASGARYRRNKAYRARKQALRDQVLAVAERAVPGVRDAIVFEETATPITHERFTRSTGGTSYGIEATPGQFLMNRPAPSTPVKGLFLAGASTMGAHGIGGTMGGGVMTASAVTETDVRALLADRLA